MKRERTIVELDDPGDLQPHDQVDVDASAVKAIELASGRTSYQVLTNRLLEPAERCAIKFSLQRPGTLRKVALRWRSVDGGVSRQESLDGARKLAAADKTSVINSNIWPTE